MGGEDSPDGVDFFLVKFSSGAGSRCRRILFGV